MSIGPPDPYTRPISATEAWFLAYPDWLPGVIQVVVEGVGPLDAGRLTKGVEAASEACPGARLTQAGRSWVDSGVAPAVRVIPGRQLDPVTFTGVPDMHRPLMGTDQGPTCEVLLLPGEPTRIVFRASHAVMDGKGIMAWIYGVFRALRGQPAAGAPSRLTDAQLLTQVTARRAPAIEADLGWPSALGERPVDHRDFFWRRRVIDGAHPGLVAKLATAITRWCGLPAGRFRIPVDLRRYAPQVRSTGNLTNNPLFDVSADDSWDVAHEKLLTMLSSGQDLAASTAPALATIPRDLLRKQLMALDRVSATRGRYGSIATLSHVGRVDLADVSAPAFQATTVYALPNSGPVGPPELNAVECAGRTEITIGWYDVPEAVRRAEELLDHLDQTLSPRAAAQAAGNRSIDGAPAPRPVTVVQQLREQARRTPAAVALTGPEGDVTFADLRRRANAVAAALRDRGIGRGHVVGLVAGRSVAGIVGIWGVLAAGAAYLPLDPQHPDRRIADLIADCGATLCLIDRDARDRRLAPATCEVVVVEELAAADRDPVEVDIAADDLAYVMYTSGSTGRPKGVEVEHRNLASYVAWATRVYGIDGGTRLPLFSSLAFDLSNTAIFVAPLAGGSVILVPDELDHVVLRNVLEKSGANTLKLTPTHLDLIGRLGIHPAGFRAVVAGGELLRTSVADAAQRTFGAGCRIFNEYGPTETTIGCMTRTYDRDRDAHLASVPIGVPTDGTQIYLLDAHQDFVGPGEVGEMYIAGDQVARGYRGRPELNLERFVTLPDGTRAYRSGDLARSLPGGELESAGRNDEQIKVLGYRIEPAEVAWALETHPSVARAFAAGRTRTVTQDKVLCAYVVVRADVTTSALQEHVRQRLPRYMVPAVTMVVPELPLTANGKVDVAALPEPFESPVSPQSAPTTVPQRVGASGPDDIEQAITQIWTRVLGIDAAQRRDTATADFHHLGGNSATLLAMVAAVSAELVGAEHEAAFMAQLKSIIRQPTVARIADLVRQLRAPTGVG